MKYPLGVQDFAKIIKRGAVYVDKTAYVHRLVEQHEMVFLSRPRRFGKSVLLSTIAALFSGDKALFDGLLISQTDYKFPKHPVIEFSFSSVDVVDADDLRQYIINTINRFAEQFDVNLTVASYEQRFAELLRKLPKPAVLLVDEYDKPILDNLNKSTLSEIKRVINAFYAAVKAMHKYLHFVLITGVSRFTKVSVFSGMNNLDDISMDSRYSTICGVTQQEMEHYFDKDLDTLAEIHNLERPQLLDKVKFWYNGYRFEEHCVGVYNPFSLISLFAKRKFINFWFETATPTFLIELLKAKQFDLSVIDQYEVDSLFFAAIEPEQMTPGPVLLQTGYLTIAEYEDGWFRLDFPNYEVKYAFNRAIVEQFGGASTEDMRYIRQLGSCLENNDIDGFFDTVKVFFANIPYDITLKHEKYYQSLFYALFTLLGFQIEVEVRTNAGRIDCVLQTKDCIYIIEFKLNGSKEDALKQIQQKQYAQKYQNSAKTLVLLGVEFDEGTRNIAGYLQG